MISVRCVVVGDRYDVLQRNAKTLFLTTYTTNAYPKEYIPSVFDDYSANYTVDGKMVNIGLFDTSGWERFPSPVSRVMSSYGADVFILLFSVVSPEMFHQARYNWGPQIREYSLNIPIILVGTDVELRESPNTFISENHTYIMDPKHPPITYEEGVELASALGAVCYLECSTLTQTGLKKVFDEAVRAVISTKPVIQTKPSKKTNSIFSPLKILSTISKMGKREEKVDIPLLTETEKTRFEREQVEKERIEREKAEKERIEREKAEKERIEREKAVKERFEIEKAVKERFEREKAEKERIEREKVEKERIEREKAEKERFEREKAEKERIEREKAEKERIEREKAFSFCQNSIT